jgi:dTDP-4-dehydrorhamnose 3,5-epimerase
MIFTETNLKGTYIVKLEEIGDERGFFARCFCQKEFGDHGIPLHIAQCNVSYNLKKGTLRGMHYQIAPHEEAKLVRCTMGAIYDVMVDLRPDSKTFRQWLGVKLSALNHRTVYIPEGFAHGYLSLTDDSMIHYMVSEPYHKESERTIRWDSPSIGIEWFRMNEYVTSDKYIISKKDRNATDI